jgi:hypothetical protein
MRNLANFARFLLVFTLFLQLFSSSSEARFAVQADATSEVQFFNRTTDIHEDGTYEELIEMKVKILNETGRSNFATQPLLYDGETQKIKIISAHTLDQGQVYPVGTEFIEDKPIASQGIGFSSYHQVLISFPHLNAGAELYLKYSIRAYKADFPGAFSNAFIYGREGYWLSSQVKLTSAIPFSYAANDPEEFLDVKSKTEGKRHVLEIQLKRPLIKQVVDEQNVQLNPKTLPWVSVTSFKDWKTLGERFSPEYERVLAAPLPGLFQDMVNQAAAEPDLFKKINRLTSSLADQVHYMGDWRSVSGRIYPNSLEKVANIRRGDCKDFSTVTVAMLRKLGIQASPALVRRGGYYDEPNDLPSGFAFDHVIVRVEEKDQVFWIDPTNFVSFSNGLFPDISDRRVLSLKKDAAGLERIPAIQANQSEVKIVESLQFVDKDRTVTQGYLEEKGSSAIGITGAGLRGSKENIDYALINFVGDPNRMTQWKFKPYDLTSRVVDDVKIQYEYEKNNTEFKTSNGPAHLIQTSSTINGYLTRVQDRVSDLLILEAPSTLKRSAHLKGVQMLGKAKLSCKVDSPWLKASRSVVQKKNAIEVDDTMLIKTALIRNEDLRSKEYSEFQEKLEDCFNNVAVVFKR